LLKILKRRLRQNYVEGLDLQSVFSGLNEYLRIVDHDTGQGITVSQELHALPYWKATKIRTKAVNGPARISRNSSMTHVKKAV